MAVFHKPLVRHTLDNLARYLRASQRRWAQVHDVRFLVTHRESNRIVDKYKDKLYEKAKQEGLKDVEELKAAYYERIQSQKRETLVTGTSAHLSSPLLSSLPPPPEASTVSQASTPAKPARPTKSPGAPGIKTLSSFVDIPKFLELPQKEIEYLWRLRHASDPRSLCAVIPQATYSRIEATARRHPQFILPLPREESGAEIHFLQWTFPTSTTTTVLFTHLAEFKSRGEYATPHTTITHHLDIAKEKGLVLLQGTVTDRRGVTADESRWLLMCLQKFYGGEEREERKKLLEQFSQGDGAFKVEDLLEEAEKIN